MSKVLNILKDCIYILLITALLAIVFSSCKATKHVPNGEYLLVKNSVKCDNKAIDNEELMSALNQKSNKKILSVIPFNLYVYNLMKSGKEKKWKEKIANGTGEEPSIYNDESVDISIQNIKSYMGSQSYYRTKVNTDKYFSKKRKKAKVKYSIESGPAYKISSINYEIEDNTIEELFFLDTTNSYIKVGHNFNTDTIKLEQERIVRFFKLNGYYYFSINNVHFYADTLKGNYNVDVKLFIHKSSGTDADDAFQSQTIRTVNVATNYDITKKEEVNENTNKFSKDGIIFTFDKKMIHRTSVILQSCFFKPGDRYSIRNVEDTYSHLSSLKQFRLINIKLTPPDKKESESEFERKKFIDVNIYLAPMKKQSYTFELEGSNTSGNIGMSGIISYKNRNIFKGAQIFSAKANISFQTSALTDTITNEDIKSNFFNTLEYGGEIKLNFPKLLFPFFDNTDFIKKHNPKTQLSFSYNFQNRPDYTRTIANLSFGYNWKGNRNKNITHNINPIELYWVKIIEFSESFREQIQNLYIRYSYEDQFMSVFSYDFIFNNQNINAKRDFSYFWLNIETCGNLMNGIYKAAGLKKIDGSYKIMGTEFAQYVKFDLDYRFYNVINEKNSLVYRAFLGIGLPYGNSTKGLPFVKRYFIGGANDIRAWQVRTLGPGSYSNIHKNYDQIADMKIMLNIEYRFAIVSFLQGALFVDAGNIWAVDKNDNRAGALFKFNEFYRQIAIGTGFGFRFDFQFLVLRFDFGIPLHNPSLPETERWFESFTPFNINKFTLNFGIGYPF